jgi:primase-polymerase (primpol)-like protein
MIGTCFEEMGSQGGKGMAKDLSRNAEKVNETANRTIKGKVYKDCDQNEQVNKADLKPKSPEIYFDNIPQELKDAPNWTLWKYVFRHEKWTKIPFQTNREEGDSSDPSKWTTYENAVKVYNGDKNYFDGIGFAFNSSGPFAGMDYDDCIDEKRSIEPVVESYLNKLNSYTEISPSLEGVKVFTKAKLPVEIKTTEGKIQQGFARKKELPEVEVYYGGRFFTVTGNILPQYSKRVEERNIEQTEIFKEIFKSRNYFGEESAKKKTKQTKIVPEIKQLSPSEADAQLKRLFEMDETFRNNYCTPAVKPNRSDIEFGLCAKMFEVGFDEKSVIRLMDASPQGKWHEEGNHYRNRTLRRAQEKVARSAREMLRTPVILGPDLSQNVDNCLMALYTYNNPPEVFQRAGSLCRIKTIDAKENRHTIENITPYALRIEMSKATVFKSKSTKKGNDEAFREVQPQLDLANCVLANSSWDFPSLNGLTNAPMIRPNGTILDCPGYDESTGFYYIPDVNLDVPEIPEKLTKEDAIEAAKFILDEILIDFPFVDNASRQNSIAMFLSPIVRPMIAGCVPLALIDKPSPGTGASKLLELISIVATGRLMSVDTAPDNEDEWRKKITSLLRDGASLIYLDNIDADLKAPTLASALTSSFWRDRLLQQSKVVEYLQRACWFATGNHLTLKGDIPRRSFLSQMDAKLERPWERETKKFRHPDINMWVKEKRGVILSKLMIMAAAWVQAGRPKGNGKIIGSFEDWVEVVGGILEFAGLNEFLGNLDKVYENLNAGNNEWSQFFRAWFEIHKDKAMKSADVYLALQSNELSDYAPNILSTKLIGIRSKDIQAIGIVLKKQVDVIFSEGLKLIQEEDKHAGSKVWKVVKISKN